MAPRKKVTSAVIPGQFILSINNPKTPTPDGWEWRKLTDLAELRTGHTPSRNKPEYWENTTIPWITSVDSTKHHGGYIYETEQNISQLGLENSAAVMLPKDTVCLSRTASVGYVVMTGTNMATSQNFANWICGDELNPHFLRYALMLEFESLSHTFAYGTTHKTIYFDDLLAFSICCPNREEQDQIVNRVLSLEEKLWTQQDILCKLNNIVSEVFNSWFIRFDPILAKGNGELPITIDTTSESMFPESFKPCPKLGQIPVGWNTESIIHPRLSSLIEPGVGEYTGEKNYIDTSCVKGTQLKSHGKKFEFSERPSRASMSPRFESIWLAKMDAGRKLLTLTRFDNQIIDSCLLSTGFFGILPNRKNALEYLHFFLMSDTFSHYHNAFSAGTMMAGLNNSSLESIPLVIPTDDILERFAKIAKPVLELNSIVRIYESSLSETIQQILSYVFPKC
jgi:restriction endonuclease S subunit